MTTPRILYDGWPLIREPNSPATLHLLALLAHLPETVDAMVAFPESPPEWDPTQAQAHVETTSNTPKARAKWYRRVLPDMVKTFAAQLLHLTTPVPSLFGTTSSVISPSGYAVESRGGFTARLQGALSQGGLARASGVFWPDDLPVRSSSASDLCLPPMVHPAFIPKEQFFPVEIPGVALPENFLLYHGPQRTRVLQRTVKAWTWSAGSIGEVYPLVMLGLGEAARREVNSMVKKLNLEGTVFVMSSTSPDYFPRLYQRASAVFHPATVSPWGGAVRHALACGVPVVGIETSLNNALVGSAAYLVHAHETREMGAGLISVVVREEVRERLKKAALERASGWATGNFGEKLVQAYEVVIGESK